MTVPIRDDDLLEFDETIYGHLGLLTGVPDIDSITVTIQDNDCKQNSSSCPGSKLVCIAHGFFQGGEHS